MVGISLAVSAILVLLNGVFVGYEFAILRSTSYELEKLVAAGNRGARFALRHKEHVNEYLAVCQLGITIVTLALTIAFEPAVQALIGPLLMKFLSAASARGISLTLAVFIATSIHVTFGELVPKSFALISPAKLVVRTARGIEILHRLSRPFIWLFNGISTYLARLVTGKPVKLQSEELDVHQVLRHSYRSGIIDHSQLELLDAVLDYPDRMVREVMTPRSELVSIDRRKPVGEILQLVTENYYTRFPVVTSGQVEGYVVVHDLFAEPHPTSINWRKVMRPILKVPETLTLGQAQEALKKTPIAAVFDEYNQFVGIVTRTDIDEEIMGELLEENEEAAPPLIEPVSDGTILINATEGVEDVFDALGLSVDEEMLDGIDSFGGFILTHLGKEPAQGDEIQWAGYRFRVEETDRFRITRVRAFPPAPAASSDGAEGGEAP